MALMVVFGAAPAGAHGGPAQIEVGDPEPAGDLTLTFPVRITYEGDGHTVDEVDGLTVSGKGPDGAELGPQDAFVAGDAPGVFVATVTLPAEGTWELIVASVEPPGSTNLVAEVASPVTETTSGDGTGSIDTAPDSPDDVAPDEVDPGDDTVGSGAAGSDAAGSGDDLDASDTAVDGDSDDSVGIPIYAIVIAVVAAGAAAVVGYRWANRKPN